MRTSSAKAKGRRLCSEIKEALYKWAPDLKVGDIEVTSSGCTGEDLKLSPAAREIYPYTIEAKCQEKLSIWDALEQAETHAEGKPELFPLLVFRRNNSETYVTLKLEHFLKLTR
jgi:hypothetical protein